MEVEVEVEAEAEAVGEAGHKRGKDYVGYKELNFLLLELYVLLIGGNLEGYLHRGILAYDVVYIISKWPYLLVVKLSNCRRIVHCIGDYFQFCLVIIIRSKFFCCTVT